MIWFFIYSTLLYRIYFNKQYTTYYSIIVIQLLQLIGQHHARLLIGFETFVRKPRHSED